MTNDTGQAKDKVKKSNVISHKFNETSREEVTGDVREQELQGEIDNLKNQLTRALADYQNQTKRFQEERSQIFAHASERVVGNLIPVLDTLVKAQEHIHDQGLEMAIGQFKKSLSDEGLEEINPTSNNSFDHTTMEAVESIEGGEKDTVSECVLSGWRFKDGRMVRYAKVKVFNG